MAKTIREQIAGKTPLERASIIADIIVSKSIAGTFTQGDYTIEVQRVSKISGGVEVFTKAWKRGQPVGFFDGTVEIERFRIYNPQFTVEDPNGEVVQTFTNSSGETKTNRAREDVVQAIKDELVHTIKVVGKSGEDVVSGKVGRTTSTFNPVAGANAPVDGYVFITNQVNWDTAHDATSSNIASPTIAADWIGAVRLNLTLVNMARSFFLFDTSAIPDTDTISAATFSLYMTNVPDGDNDGNDFLSVVTSTPASDADVTTADYDQVGDAINNPTEQHDTSQRKDITGISTGAYLDWTLNATGIGNISKTGNTKFGVREGHDILDDPIADSSTYTGAEARYADDVSGTPPKLVVVHAGAAGPANLKSLDTNLTANIKSYNTNLIANIKSIDTNS